LSDIGEEEDRHGEERERDVKGKGLRAIPIERRLRADHNFDRFFLPPGGAETEGLSPLPREK